MVAAGWQARTPTPRKGKPTSTATYIRFVYMGRKHRAVTAMNTLALIFGGQNDRPIADVQPGAEVRPKETYVYHSGPSGDLDTAYAAADAVRRAADGES